MILKIFNMIEGREEVKPGGYEPATQTNEE